MTRNPSGQEVCFGQRNLESAASSRKRLAGTPGFPAEKRKKWESQMPRGHEKKKQASFFGLSFKGEPFPEKKQVKKRGAESAGQPAGILAFQLND